MGLHGRQHRIETSRVKGPHLVQRALGEHPVEPCVDPLAKFAPVGIQENLRGMACVENEFLQPELEGRNSR